MKLQDGVYNKAVFWPTELQKAINQTMRKRYKIVPTFHAKEKIAKLDLPQTSYKIALCGEIVEVEIKNDNVNKIITRTKRKSNKGNYNQDVCSVVVFDYENFEARVKTMWLNATDDAHKTLHIENYISENLF